MCSGALDVMLDGARAESGSVHWEMVHKTDRGTWLEMDGLLQNKTLTNELPVVFCHPKKWNGKTVVWLSGEGKRALFEPDGKLKADLKELVEGGTTLLGVDLLYQGEFLADGKGLTKTPKVKNPREAAAYTFGYNYSVFAQRVQDIFSVVRFLKTYERQSKEIVLVGLEGAGPWVAAARSLCGKDIDRAVVDTGGFRFGKVLDIGSADFLPGGAKYGDVPGMLALGAPGKLWVAGESDNSLALTEAQYRAAGAEKNLVKFTGEKSKARNAALEWLSQAK